MAWLGHRGCMPRRIFFREPSLPAFHRIGFGVFIFAMLPREPSDTSRDCAPAETEVSCDSHTGLPYSCAYRLSRTWDSVSFAHAFCAPFGQGMRSIRSAWL